MSAAANFAGALVGTEVAETISGGIIDPQVESPDGDRGRPGGRDHLEPVHLAPRHPVSSSHALIGGLLGASLIVGRHRLLADRRHHRKVLLPLVARRSIGFTVGLLMHGPHLQRVPKAHTRRRLNDRFRRLQVLSAAFMAFSHGSNDAQKTMGIMTLALVTAGVQTDVRGAAVGDPHGRERDQPRDRRRRLADHQDDGQQGREARPGPWLRGRDHRGQRHLRRVVQSACRSARRTSSARRSWASARRIGSSRPLGRGPLDRDAWVLTIPASGTAAALAYSDPNPS